MDCQFLRSTVIAPELQDVLAIHDLEHVAVEIRADPSARLVLMKYEAGRLDLCMVRRGKTEGAEAGGIVCVEVGRLLGA